MTEQELKNYRGLCAEMEAYPTEAVRNRKQAIEEWVEAIPCVQTRLMVRARYLEGRSWQQVAIVTHNTADSCRKIVKRYLHDGQNGQNGQNGQLTQKTLT